MEVFDDVEGTGIKPAEAIRTFDIVDIGKLLIIFAFTGFVSWAATRLIVYTLVRVWQVNLPDWA